MWVGPCIKAILQHISEDTVKTKIKSKILKFYVSLIRFIRSFILMNVDRVSNFGGDRYKVGSRVEYYLWLNIVNQSEAYFIAFDWIKFSYHSLVTDSARL